MKIVTVQNGVITMYIQPETEIEKLQLASLFSGSVDSKIHATIQVGTKSLVDTVEITPVKKETT